jgi:hypothetical protein
MARISSIGLVAGFLSVASSGCTSLAALPAESGDAATWGDVALPDVSIPDGYLITELTADGGATALTAAAACEAILAPDAGADVGGVAPTLADAEADASACSTPLSPGDLVFDEVMIATQPGSDDRGQWLEVRSTRACAVDLIGLHASALHGESFRTVDVTVDTWLPPRGFFLIADTTDPSENNSLPGLVFAWAGSPADALHKTSDVITLSSGTILLDTLTYPDKTRPEATSVAFPSNCAPGLRASFASWKPSTHEWAPGLYGTPGAPNTDVSCAAPKAVMCKAAHRP